MIRAEDILMPTTPPFPTEERPNVWRTRWRSDPDESGKRHQHVQRFKGTRRQVEIKFKRWLKHWKANGALQNPRSKIGMTIADLCVAYLAHAQMWYVKAGRPTSRVWNVKAVLQRLINDLGDVLADQFTPPMLAEWRKAQDDEGAVKRKTINEWLTIIRQAWDWGAENGYVHPDVALRLSKVKLLQKGRCNAEEYQPVGAVHWSIVEATLPRLSPAVAEMATLQWHTGMRPIEVCGMRGCDLDTSGDVWLYHVPEDFDKTAHHEGHKRAVALGPKSQAIIQPRLTHDLSAFLFRPSENERARGEVGNHYTTNSYRKAIQRACDAAFPPPDELARGRANAVGRKHSRLETDAQWRERLGEGHWTELQRWVKDHRWSPNQLRHAKESALEKAEGMEASRLALGHSTATTTLNYGKREREQRELEALKKLALKYG